MSTLEDYSFQYPEHRAFADTWAEARGDKPLPVRADLPLTAFTANLDTLTIMRLDPERFGYVTYAGPYVRDLWGVDFLGKRVQDVLPPKFAKGWLDILGKMTERPFALFTEMGFDRGQAQIITSSTLYLPVLADATGALCAYFMAMRDSDITPPPPSRARHTVFGRMIALDLGEGIPFEPYILRIAAD